MKMLPQLPNGMGWALGDDGRLTAVPVAMQFPGQATEGMAYEATHSFGQHPLDRKGGIEDDPRWRNFTRIPAFYTVTINMPAEQSGPSVADSSALRPEPFICKRVTWATTGDTPLFCGPSASGGSAQGRAVVAEWDDEFTKFLGSKPCLISALFGDSQGFLDIPRGVLFQGKQSLTVRLTRLFWPDSTNPAATRFDFSFQGIGMLPLDVNQSGSAG